MLKTVKVCLVIILMSGCSQKNNEQEKTMQSLPFHHISLQDMSGFQKMEGTNWGVAKDVYANRNKQHHLQGYEGKGVLINRPDDNNDDNNKDNLFTTFEHGDLDIELDFMMPKGSNSGLYLQGRYEVQLFDSWLEDSVTFGDCGGIYQRFDFTTNKGFEGSRPSVNAAKAPGLWQHVKIRFRAPRFDASGRKVRNARFDWVYLNEVLIQKDVEITGPTLGAAFEDEQPLGALMIQGDHGPVAFRNIQYRTYNLERLSLGKLDLKVYKSMYTNPDTLESLEPIKTLKVDSLSHSHYNEFEQGLFSSTLEVPRDGNYLFILQSGGPSWLYIDSKLVTDNNKSGDYFSPGYGHLLLTEGKHDFTLIYNNRHGNLSLSYEGPGMPLTLLSAEKSAKRKPPNEPLVVAVNQDPVVQRGFMVNKETKRTHVISVGIPGGVNYSYDLENFSVLNTWHGSFIDAADMWRSRGEQQLIKPLGGIVELYNQPSLAVLPSDDPDAWPASVEADANVYTGRGYQLSEKGLPVYFYTLGEMQVEDRLFSAPNNEGLKREISLKGEAALHLYCRIATGKTIEKLPDGSFAIDDKNYYIDHLELGKASPAIHNGQDMQSLVVPLGNTNNRVIRYSIIW